MKFNKFYILIKCLYHPDPVFIRFDVIRLDFISVNQSIVIPLSPNLIILLNKSLKLIEVNPPA